MKSKVFGIVAVLLALSAPADAAILMYTTTASSGVVPGTSIDYTLTDAGGTPRNVFPGATSDNGVWTWTGGFPEFLTAGPQTLTVTFSDPVKASAILFGLDSTSASTSSFTVSGGTADTADFNLTDSLNVYNGDTGIATYNAAAGTITAPGQDQSIIIGSSSGDTLTQLVLHAGASDGGADGYTAFFGLTEPVPEPSSIVLLTTAVFGLVRLRRRA